MQPTAFPPSTLSSKSKAAANIEQLLVYSGGGALEYESGGYLPTGERNRGHLDFVEKRGSLGVGLKKRAFFGVNFSKQSFGVNFVKFSEYSPFSAENWQNFGNAKFEILR